VQLLPDTEEWYTTARNYGTDGSEAGVDMNAWFPNHRNISDVEHTWYRSHNTSGEDRAWYLEHQSRGFSVVRRASPWALHGVLHMLAQVDTILSHGPREQGVHLAHVPGGLVKQQLAIKPRHVGLHKVVMMLVEEVRTPGVCEKKPLIMEKLLALMKRLGGRAATVNATDAKYQKEAQTALNVW